MNPQPHTAPFYMADWYVDTNTNRLVKEEQVVKLESRVMAVLIHLARHPDELVTREALEQAVWGNTVVGYDALTRCIAQLRKALQDDSRNPRYIETIAKKGYRLISTVAFVDPARLDADAPSSAHVPQPDDDAHQALRPKWSISRRPVLALLLPALLLLILLMTNQWWPADSKNESMAPSSAMDTMPSILVLPFVNLSNDPEQDYFSQGITSDISTALANLSGLRVMSTPITSNTMHSPDLSGVQFVVQGEVRRDARRVRVIAGLIDTRDNRYLWSEKYDRNLDSIFDVQDDITGNIIRALSIELTDAEKRRIAQRFTTSIDAYDDFLRGQAYYMRHSLEDNQQAQHYFEQAILRDSGFVRAYSAMALTYTARQRYGWAPPSQDDLDKALQLARRGIAVDNALPQSYWVLGYVHLFRREYTEAEQAASEAVRINPRYADSYLTLAMCKMHRNHADQAVPLIRKAMLLNPEYPAAYASILGQAYYFNHQYEQAVTALNDAIERNNNLLTAHLFLISALNKLDRHDDAAWAAEQVKLLSSNFSTQQLERILGIQETSRVEDIKQQLREVGF